MDQSKILKNTGERCVWTSTNHSSLKMYQYQYQLISLLEIPSGETHL